MDTSDIWIWTMQHEWQLAGIVSYVLLNVGPRPHPESLTGYKRIFWLLVDRIAWLSAEKVPGNWKWIFSPSPLPPSLAAAAPAPAVVVVPKTATDPDAVTLPGKVDDDTPTPPPAA